MTTREALASLNGGPGATVEELSAMTGRPRDVLRFQLADLVFVQKVVTCEQGGRYKLGDPVADRLVVAGKGTGMPGPPG